MAKQVVSNLIDTILKKNVYRRADLELRRYGRSFGHLHTISKQDIKDLIAYNSVAILQKEALENGMGNDQGERIGNFLAGNEAFYKEAEALANFVFEKYDEEYNKSISGAKKEHLKAVNNGTEIIIYQSTLNDDALRKPIISLVKDNAKNYVKLKDLAKESNLKDMGRRTQFLHKKGTVGLLTLDALGDALNGKTPAKEENTFVRSDAILQKEIDKAFQDAVSTATGKSISTTALRKAKAAGSTVINNLMEELAVNWASDELLNFYGYDKSIKFVGTIGPNTKNKPGEESSDWSNIRPRIEKAIIEEFQKSPELVQFATAEASTPPATKVTRAAIHSIGKELKKNKHRTLQVELNLDKLEKEQKSSDSFISKGKKNLVKASAGLGIKRSARMTTKPRRKNNKQSNINQVDILRRLNQNLNRVVTANMKYPALESQTGRFASSVRATSVLVTPQGFPSIGYTYQKNPYQIFELGQGDKRWATRERDPRAIIDKSIREIVADYAVGRFYTRRE